MDGRVCWSDSQRGFDSRFDPHLDSQPAIDFASVKYPVLRAAGYHLVTKVSNVTVVPYQRSSHGDPFRPAPPPASPPFSGRATSLSGLLCHSLSTHPSVLIVLPLHHSPTTPYRISQSSAAHHGCVTHHSREKTPRSGGTHGRPLGLINISHMPVHRALAFLPAYLPGPAVLRLRPRRRGGIPEWRLGPADTGHTDPVENPKDLSSWGRICLRRQIGSAGLKANFAPSPTTYHSTYVCQNCRVNWGPHPPGFFEHAGSRAVLSCLRF